MIGPVELDQTTTGSRAPLSARRDARSYTAAMTDTELIARIKESSLLQGEFTLRSGRKSNYYLDKYLFATQPDILAALGNRFARLIDHDIDRLAGAELGGIPLVAAASMATGKPSIFVRKEKKDYGTGKLLEGRLDPQDRVAIIEDIATTGGQTCVIGHLKSLDVRIFLAHWRQ